MAYGIFGNKAVILSRVSTQEQVLQKGFSPQQNDLILWAKTIGYTEFHQIDSAESGFLELEARDGWRRIFSFLDEHPDYKTIIATEINRLARNESVLMEVKNYLYKHKVQLIIKDLQFFLLNPDGEKSLSADLMFNIYTSMAHFEMINKNDRKTRALTEYRKEGYSIGGKELFGYTRQVGGKLGNKKNYIINEDEAEEIRTIYKWYAYGIDGDSRPMSVLRITQECIARGMSEYLHSKRNVGKCLKEEAYTGHKTTKNKKKNPEYWNYKNESAPKYIDATSYEWVYPRIVEQSLFDDVKKMLTKRNSKNNESNEFFVDKSSKHTTILSKLIVCPRCSKYLNGEYRVRDGEIKHTYRCASSRGVLNACEYKSSHSMVLLDSVVWAYLKTYVGRIIQKKLDILAKTDIEEIKTAISRLEEKVRSFESKLDAESVIFRAKVGANPTKKYLEEATNDYKAKVQNIERERESYQREIESRRKQLRDYESQQQSLLNANKISDLSSIEQNKEEMYRYVHLLIEEIYPAYSSKQFTVLEVISIKSTDDIDMDKTNIKRREKASGTVSVLFIDKRDTNNIKVKLVDGMVGWNSDIERLQPIEYCPIEGHPELTTTDEYYDLFALSLEDIFSQDWANSSFIEDMSKKMGYEGNAFEIVDLPFHKLTFYDIDSKKK